MEAAEWIVHNWFSLLQSLSIVLGLLFTAMSVRAGTRSRQLANLLTLTQQHRELWTTVLVNPQLKRVVDPHADLSKRPVTREEELIITSVFLHLNSAFWAAKEKQFISPEGLVRDIRLFFALPIPREVWSRTRAFLDGAFVGFVERAAHGRPEEH